MPMDKKIIPCQYDKVSGFENGVATVSKDGKAILMKKIHWKIRMIFK